MDGNGEKKTIRQYFLDWWLPVVAIVLIIGTGRFFYLWSDRNYGQLTTSLITVLGVVVTLWMTQVRAIEQQEREDKRHHARLEAEAKMHDERLRAESEREHERLTAEARKDRAQRSITQRIDLAEKLAAAIEHLSSENELKQAAAIQEILFQIDDWHTLIRSEIAGIDGSGKEVEAEKNALRREGLRHRQELFDIAYKFDTENINVLKSRARGLRQRLRKEGPYSLAQLDFSGMIIGWSGREIEGIIEVDLKDISANGFIMSNANMRYVNLGGANFELADLRGVDFGSANLEHANLGSANLKHANLGSADLRRAHLVSARLWGANLAAANLEDASLEKADMGNANLREAILQWSNLKLTNLWNANLELSDFWFANLEGANLQGVNLKSAGLEGANLGMADLRGANLEFGDLRGTNLKSADLRGANLESIELEGTSLRSAIMWGVDFETFNMEDTSIPWGAFDGKNPLKDSKYNDSTSFSKGFSPEKYGMIYVDEKNAKS